MTVQFHDNLRNTLGSSRSVQSRHKKSSIVREFRLNIAQLLAYQHHTISLLNPFHSFSISFSRSISSRISRQLSIKQWAEHINNNKNRSTAINRTIGNKTSSPFPSTTALKTNQLEVNTDVRTLRPIARLKEPRDLFALPKERDNECAQQLPRWPNECQVRREMKFFFAFMTHRELSRARSEI